MNLLTIGELARRSGLAPSALRFYEQRGLIRSERSRGNQRRYARSALRVVSVVRAAQALGLTLAEIEAELAALPEKRAPTQADWAKLARSWRTELELRIERLSALRDRLDGCIGCGCLSLKTCAIYNPSDRAAALGDGARYLSGDDPEPT